MIVEILRSTNKIKAKVGDVVSCPAEVGNPLACIGVVRVVSHDDTTGMPGSQMLEEYHNEPDEE